MLYAHVALTCTYMNIIIKSQDRSTVSDRLLTQGNFLRFSVESVGPINITYRIEKQMFIAKSGLYVDEEEARCQDLNVPMHWLYGE